MSDLITRREGRVGWIVFSNLTKRNALSYDIWRGIPDAVRALALDTGVRVIALRGDGADFSAGADVAEFEHARDSISATSSYNVVVDEANEALVSVPKPTLAMIRGLCYGGGLAMALHCDMRICADNAQFSLQAAKLGFGISYASTMRFAHVVGPAHSAEVMFSGKIFGAEEAYHMHLVNRVAPADQLDAVFGEWSEMFANAAPLAVASIKRSLVEGYKDPDRRDLRSVAAMIEACYTSDDYREGRAAFRAGRKPEFKGR
ncbi:MAG TPA: enoyl-CoA hydratase-related protein [Burkholderiales bacterium]